MRTKWAKVRRRLLRLFPLVCFGLLLVGVAIVWLQQPIIDNPRSAARQQPTKTEKPHAVTAASNTLFFGNVYWGRYINEWSAKSGLMYAYPFSRLSEFHRDQYDAWIAGLECPVTAGANPTAAQEEATLSFNCRPEYLSEAAKWFTAFTLANNHTDNQGVSGFTETQQQLEAVGIQYLGSYDPRDLANLCDVIALPARITDSAGQTTAGTLPIAICGYHGFYMIPPAESIAVMREYASYMPVIALPHMGTEYKPAPDQIKTDTYRAMIDAGADMVLGDHPHWVQTSESYKGHPIIYSMGNFIFDQQLAPETTRSAGVRVEFTVEGADRNQLAKWLALGKTCATYHDDCLAKAKASKLTKLPYNYHLSIIGTDNAGKLVKPASPAVQAGILERLGWSQTITALQPPYSGE